MLRAIILVLVLFVAVGTIVPLATDYAEAGAQKTEWRREKKVKRFKNYRKYITSRYVRGKNPNGKYRKPKKAAASKKPGQAAKTVHRSGSRKYRRTRTGSKRARASRPSNASRTPKSANSPKSANNPEAANNSEAVERSEAVESLKSVSSSKTAKSVRRSKSKSRNYRRAKSVRSASKSVKTAKTRRVRKYSKKWWSDYRAKTDRKETIAKRKRDLRLRRIRLARKKTPNAPTVPKAPKKQVTSISGNAVLPVWMKEKLKDEIRRKMIENSAEKSVGSEIEAGGGNGANPRLDPDLIVVTNAVSAESGRKDVAGVAISDLRKTVIDKMIREQGWVVNDLEKYVDGKKVYVVVAKSPDAGGVVRSRVFYFAESRGRIYSLATVAPDEANLRIADQTEKLVRTLRGEDAVPAPSPNGVPVQSAKKTEANLKEKD